MKANYKQLLADLDAARIDHGSMKRRDVLTTGMVRKGSGDTLEKQLSRAASQLIGLALKGFKPPAATTALLIRTMLEIEAGEEREERQAREIEEEKQRRAAISTVAAPLVAQSVVAAQAEAFRLIADDAKIAQLDRWMRNASNDR